MIIIISHAFNLCVNMQVSMYAAYVYDATMLYLLTIEKMIKAGVDYHDGTIFLKYAKTVLFLGKYINYYNRQNNYTHPKIV